MAERLGVCLDGSLCPNVARNSPLIALGPDVPKVSKGGNEIVVEEHEGRKYVFFYTFRGILDPYSGFLFVPEGGDPTLYSDLGEVNNTELVKFDDRRFYASHH